MRRDEIFPSSWLKAEHLLNDDGKPIAKRVKITGIETGEVKDDSGNTKKQRVLSFDKTEKRLGLNLTNWNSLAKISGQDPDNADDEKFVGLEIEVYHATVEFKGKPTGAVRVRPVGGWDAAVKADDSDSEVPF